MLLVDTRHAVDTWPAPLDPNFTGAGRCLTDSQGRYSFITVKPGAYPWRNHDNAWRPAHIHFSLFGRAFTQRLVTQMYFPGDPLFFQDPITRIYFSDEPELNATDPVLASVPSERRATLLAQPDDDAFRFDIHMQGSDEIAFSPSETHDRPPSSIAPREPRKASGRTAHP